MMKHMLTTIGLVLTLMVLTSCGEQDEGPYTITFDHENIDSVEADIDSEIELPFLESDTGFFLGWEDELGTIHEDTYIVDGDSTLTSVFELFEDVLELVFNDEDNAVRIAEYNGSATRVKIPHTMDDYFVRGIAYEAFKETNVTRVDLPMTVNYVGIKAFANMPNLEEVHYYGEYLGTVETTLSSNEFNDVIDDNDGCQSTSMDDDPTEENPWEFEEGCPIAKVTGITEPTIGPDGKTYFAYEIEQPLKYAPLSRINQMFSMTPFTGSDTLTTVTLPDKLGFFDSQTFLGAENIEAVYIENNTKIYSDNGIIFETDTDNLAYYPSGQLTQDLVIPNNIEHINKMAFISRQVETLTLHDNLTFEPGAFAHLTGLKTILIDGELSSLSIVDNVVFNEDETELLVYPAGKEVVSYTIPDTVVSIEPFAFMNQQHVEHVVISEGVEAIMDNAFYINPSLTTVDIASTVEYIGFNNFWNAQNEETLETMVIRNEEAVIHAPAINLNNKGDFVIYIPDELMEAYASDMFWGPYADYMEPLSELDE